MPLELAVAAGSALLALVLVCTRALRRGSATPEVDEGAAWRFVDGKAEEHIDELVAAWREAGSAEAAGGCSPFTRQIESFIGTVLMRACVSAMGDAELRDEVRELLVLEREQVYERILARIEERLAEIASA
jgi:hypothetical protein